MDAAGRGRPRRYCSDRCRTAAMRERRAGRNAIPYEMTHADLCGFGLALYGKSRHTGRSDRIL